jgi:PilZ domain
MGTIPPPSRSDNDAQRRSQRVILKVTVVVLAHGADNKLVSEVTRTVTVNAHGARVVLGLKVSIGQLLTLGHSGTEEEVSCRVVYSSPHQAEKREVGVEFMNSSPGFWRISFPPSDWTMRSPEAPKPKETESIALPNQLQKPRNEIWAHRIPLKSQAQ